MFKMSFMYRLQDKRINCCNKYPRGNEARINQKITGSGSTTHNTTKTKTTTTKTTLPFTYDPQKRLFPNHHKAMKMLQPTNKPQKYPKDREDVINNIIKTTYTRPC